MKLKRFLALTLALIMVFALAACGSEGADNDTDQNLEGTTIKVGASPTPHARILEIAKEILAEQGITLEIIEFTDYVQPCTATNDGDIDANYFAHLPYIENFNEENDMSLVSVAAIHYEPFGLYPGNTATVDELQDGAKIAVPNDGTNEARALMLLEAQGIIKLAEGAGLKATKLDIVDNPKNIDVVEMEAAQIPGSLVDVDMAVINGNYAIDAGLSVKNDAVASEDEESAAAQTYANVLVVKGGDENNPSIIALTEALKSEKVRNFIEETFDGAVVPMF